MNIPITISSGVSCVGFVSCCYDWSAFRYNLCCCI